MLSRYVPPEPFPAIDEELHAFMARRQSERPKGVGLEQRQGPTKKKPAVSGGFFEFSGKFIISAFE